MISLMHIFQYFTVCHYNVSRAFLLRNMLSCVTWMILKHFSVPQYDHTNYFFQKLLYVSTSVCVYSRVPQHNS